MRFHHRGIGVVQQGAAAHGAMVGKAGILCLGDGMSFTTVAAAYILEGQHKGASGGENRLS
ncbi:MAG TPA: hypothetical protein ACQGQI_10935 [Xylella sp.]